MGDDGSRCCRREHALGGLPVAGARARPQPGLLAARRGSLLARSRDELRGLSRPLRPAAPVRGARRRHGAPARRLPVRARRGAHLGAARRCRRGRPLGPHLALQSTAGGGRGWRRAALGGDCGAARPRCARRGANGAAPPFRRAAAERGGAGRRGRRGGRLGARGPRRASLMTTAVREERKVLTAVFADVIGSTALAERLDAEDVKLVVGEAVARIVGEVETLGGHVKDLAGDGVLAFFGAPTTREDDAERAVRCALRVVSEMEEYAREVRRGWGAEGFGVRVGLATGAVVVGEVGAGSRIEYAAFGDTVNVAARLQSAAEPGSVLVDDTTHRAVEGLFEWGPPQELDLKGKSQPVPAWPAVGVAASGRTQRGLPGVETRLVGRSRELGLGREALEALRAGRGGVLVVAGDAGIGKSRLLNELRDLAERDGTGWLEGRCVSYGESLPYWPFRDLLRGEWIGAGAEEPELRVRVGLRRRLEQLFGAGADELYPYLGGLLEVALEHEASARTSPLSPEALQWRTFEVVGQLFARLSESAPLVLAFEDLHWADATSVLLLEQLLSLAEEAPVLLVLSLRPERDHGSWALREHAGREFPHLLREIDLGPLGDADGELLAALIAPARLPADLEKRVLGAADGNPFFLEEVV